MKRPLISFRDYSFRYFMRKTPALLGINLTIDKGEFIVITGASGSGKSTLAYSMLGLIPFFYSGYYEGKVLFYGEEIAQKNLAEYSRRVGYVSQRIDNSFATPYVFSELAFPLEYSTEASKREIGRQVVSHATELDVKRFLPRKVHNLSEGEKQLVSFGSASINGIELIVADEPLANLDKTNRKTILKKLQEFHNSGKTLVITTHDYQSYSEKATRIIHLDEGKIRGEINVSSEGKASSIDFSELENVSFKTQFQMNKTSGSIIEVKDIKFNYSKDFQMDKITLSAIRGQSIGITGDNGSGKTTLLKIICGLIKPKEGDVFINGESIQRLSWREIAKIIGVVFQDPDKQFFESSVEEEILSISKNLDISQSMSDVSSILKECKMEGYESYSPQSLSFGEKRRLAFLSAIQHHPEIVLLDEITIGLDQQNKTWLHNKLVELKKSGRTIFIVSHNLSWLVENTDIIIEMKNGQISSVIETNQIAKIIKQIDNKEGRK